MKIKKDAQLPKTLFVARNWDEMKDTDPGAFDARLTPESHSAMERDVIVGEYKLVAYSVVKNETAVVPADEA